MSHRGIPPAYADHGYSWLHWKSWRFLQLLIFLVAVLLINPLQSSHPLLMVIMQLVLLNGMIVSLSAAGYPPRMRGILFAAWLICVMLDGASRMVGTAETAADLGVASHLVAVILLTGCVIATLRYVLLSRQVTTDSICAAIVAYLFIGLAFSSAYYCLVVLDAQSFSIPPDMPFASSAEIEISMIYYSFVTLATLGYGDIAPRLPLSQMLAVIEAIIGQFYIAVVIAWLMSVYAATRTRVQPGRHPDE
ncbi:MAG TPA: potassium channel family protein [Gammaproteobacteria bacterium]